MSRPIQPSDLEEIRVFNASCSSLRFEEASVLLSHYEKIAGVPARVFLGADFWATNENWGRESKDSVAFYLAQMTQRFYRVKYLFSLKALRYAVRNLFFSNAETMEKERAKRYSLYSVAPDGLSYLSGSPAGDEAALLNSARRVVVEHTEDFRYSVTELRELKESHADLKIVPFITPVAEEYLRQLVKLGFYPHYEQFVRDCVEIFGFVWNFMYSNSITRERSHFCDAIHLTNQSARHIAQRISGGKDFPEDFGILVTRENLEEHLTFLRRNLGEL